MKPEEISTLLSNKLGLRLKVTEHGHSGQIEIEHPFWDLITYDIDHRQLMVRHNNGWTVSEHYDWWANLALLELSKIGFTNLYYLGEFGASNSHFVYDGKLVHRVDFYEDCTEINTLS